MIKKIIAMQLGEWHGIKLKKSPKYVQLNMKLFLDQDLYMLLNI